MKKYYSTKALFPLICLILIGFTYQEANSALLLATYQKMRLIREKNGSDDFIKSDSIAAYNRNVSAMIRYGNWCLRNNREKEGIELLGKASNMGNDTAKCYLAEAYYWGINGNSNPSMAGEIIKGLQSEEVHLLKGIMFYDGKNYVKNYRKAVENFEKVGEESIYYPLACYYLSKCYRYGRGVNKDLDKSVEFMNKACIRPLNARNIEETKPSQFIEIVYPERNNIAAEIESYKKICNKETENAKPSFGLR